MTLREKLKAKLPPERTVVVDGDEFRVVGLTRSVRLDKLAESRDEDGKLDSPALERALLSACVIDTDGQPVFGNGDASCWDNVPAATSAPLVQAVIEVNGLDAQDTGRAEKN